MERGKEGLVLFGIRFEFSYIGNDMKDLGRELVPYMNCSIKKLRLPVMSSASHRPIHHKWMSSELLTKSCYTQGRAVIDNKFFKFLRAHIIAVT